MTIALDRTAVAVVPAPKDLIPRDLYAKLVARVMEDEQIPPDRAVRIVDQTLIFLKACADAPGRNLSPTKAVDPGWHAFILHTEDYANFCDTYAGAFIHHRPICNNDIRSGTALGRTVEAIRATGYPIDWELWTVDEADCHQCHATCHDSP
ncbi:glycine-rich domain-containing protein [Spirillospora sp. CA-255316]